jgi:hypothetical protein
METIQKLLKTLYKIIPDEWYKVIVESDQNNIMISYSNDDFSNSINLNTLKEISDYSESVVSNNINEIKSLCKEIGQNCNKFKLESSIYGDVSLIRYKSNSEEIININDINFIDNEEYFDEKAEPLEWFFVKPLKDLEFIDDFEEDYNCKLLDDFRDLFMKNNGGSPSKARFHIAFVGQFKVAYLLSFNDKKYYKNEELVVDVLKYIRNHNHNYQVLPFASVGFNNYICLNNKYEVVLFNTNKNKTYRIAKNLKKFLGSLKR